MKRLTEKQVLAIMATLGVLAVIALVAGLLIAKDNSERPTEERCLNVISTK